MHKVTNFIDVECAYNVIKHKIEGIQQRHNLVEYEKTTIAFKNQNRKLKKLKFI